MRCDPFNYGSSPPYFSQPFHQRVTYLTQPFSSKKFQLHFTTLPFWLKPHLVHIRLHSISWTHFGCSSPVSTYSSWTLPLPIIHLPISAIVFSPQTLQPSRLTSAKPSHAVEFQTEERMGWLLRAEPEGPKCLEGYPQVKDLLKKAKWLRFIQKFKGHNKEVTKAFARSFNGQWWKLETLSSQYWSINSSCHRLAPGRWALV